MTERDNKGVGHTVKPCLETPRVSGYRSGMSATGLIGQRLANVYDVATELPRDIGTLLHSLDGKVGRVR